MTDALAWRDLFTDMVTPPADDLWMRPVWQTLWFVPLVWCVCRSLNRRCPALRAWLWWAGCVQMLGVCFVALHALLCDDAGTPGSLVRLLTGMWGVGLAARVALLVTQFRRARRLVRECIPAPPCAAIETTAWLSGRLVLRTHPSILVSPRLKMPALAGLRRPNLLLPASVLDQPVTDELRMALAHELAHLRRRDLWLGLAPVLAQTLLFFHPFVWVAVREYALAREEACDAEARRVTQASPGEYGTMLLKYVTAAGASSRAKHPRRSEFHPLQMRLKALNSSGQKPRPSSLAAFCTVCVLGAAGIVLQWTQPASSRMASVAPRMTETDRRSNDRLSEEFSQDTTYSQPIILPPHHHRKVSRPVVGSGLRAVESARDTRRQAMLTPRVTGHSVERRIAVLPRLASRNIEKQSPRDDEAAKALPVKEGAAAHETTPMTVAGTGETPPPHSAVGRADLGTTESALPVLPEPTKQEGAPRPMLGGLSAVIQADEQIQEQSGPQFQQRWKHHILELRVESGGTLPVIRAQSVSDLGRLLLPAASADKQVTPLFPSRIQTRIREKVILEFWSSYRHISPLALGTW